MGADRRADRFERTRLGGAGAAAGQREHAMAASGVQAGTLPRRVGGVLPQPVLAAALRVRELAGGGRKGRAAIGDRELHRSAAPDGWRSARGRRADAGRVDFLARRVRREALQARAEEETQPPAFVQGREERRRVSTGKEPFLSRWSRRKLDSAKDPVVPPEVATEAKAPPATAVPPAARPAAKTELPPVDTLKGLASEYEDFLRPGVDEKLRQSALKKLFHDPHFNVRDGLDTYIDDYSGPDPIPEEMLKSLKQANRLLFPEEAAEKDREIEARAARTAVADAGTAPADDERMAPEPESRPAEDSKPPAKPA